MTLTSHGGHFTGTLKSTMGTTKKACACEKNWCPVCGIVKCIPVRETKWAKGTLGTTYKRDYDEKKGIPGERGEIAEKDKRLVPTLGPFDPTTTNRKDYTPKRADPWGRRSAQGPIPYRPFDGRTTYNTYHDGKKGAPADPFRKGQQDYQAPFLGTTTNRADFIPWGDQRRSHTAPASALPDQPFDGTTTYRDDFTKKKLPPRDPRDPAPLLPSNNLDNYTTYATDYVEKEMRRRKGECCDNPHHPADHLHFHKTGIMREAVGNTTGRLYRLRD